jgi:hypothetical protein
MKKVILSAIMSFALLAAMPLMAQDTKKAECPKTEKKECCKAKDAKDKKACCKADAKKDEKKATCCSKDKKAKDKK